MMSLASGHDELLGSGLHRSFREFICC